MVTALSGLIAVTNANYTAANPITQEDGTVTDPPPAIKLADFDLALGSFEDEVAEEDNSRGVSDLYDD